MPVVSFESTMSKDGSYQKQIAGSFSYPRAYLCPVLDAVISNPLLEQGDDKLRSLHTIEWLGLF